MHCSVVGLGKLGASMTAAMASKGIRVTGVDVDREKVSSVNAGLAPVQETDLGETIADNQERIRATDDHAEAVRASDVTFLVVPTPSDDEGAFSLRYLREACRGVAQGLRSKDSYHTVVVTSTVLPGSTRHGLLPVLEDESGRSAGKDFGLCYSPEFIALGSVIRDFLAPDFTLVGEYDRRSGDVLEDLYTRVLDNDASCKRMTLENAELAKVAVNTFVTTKVTFANMLAHFCDEMPGGDVDIVTDALGGDSRIGHEYLTGALGFGGPCFPRDNIALSYFANQLGCGAPLAEVTDEVNRRIPKRIVRRLREHVDTDATVAVLGLAYKPDSHVVEESQGVYLAQTLSREGVDVRAYDPLANEEARRVLDGGVEVVDELGTCLRNVDGAIVATRDPEFAALTADDFVTESRAEDRPVVVLDCWRLLSEALRDAPGVKYLPYGWNRASAGNSDRLSELWQPPSDSSRQHAASGSGRMG